MPPHVLRGLKRGISFERAQPFPHALIPGTLQEEYARRLFVFLEQLPFRWRRVVEPFYAHEVCNLLDLARRIEGPLTELIEGLRAEGFRRELCALVGVPEAHGQLVALTGHRLYDGDQIGPHSDTNDLGAYFRVLLFPDPAPRFGGGCLVLHGPAGGGAPVVVPYAPFEAFVFRFEPHAVHSVTAVEAPDGARRTTILATFGRAEGG